MCAKKKKLNTEPTSSKSTASQEGEFRERLASAWTRLASSSELNPPPNAVPFKIAVIGLGLIGASMAMALAGFRNAVIVGVDNNGEVIKKAEKSDVFDKVTTNAQEAISGADLVIICIYPDNIIPFINENLNYFKSGALITDVCGVKENLAREITKILPPEVDYVGSHPMAGKEVEGIDNAEATLFLGTGFIVTPIEISKEDNIQLIKELAVYIGADKLATATPSKHDEIIAYTSDLMHISAAALCLDFHADMTLAYAAGAFRDSTRVAFINPELWSELFLKNKEHTLNEIDRFISSVNLLRESIQNDDKERLYELLNTVRNNKSDMQQRF